MSNQNAAPLSSASLFLEPVTEPVIERSPSMIVVHHPKPEPAEHMCTCGKVREACVHEEIRALWGSVGATSKDLGK
jgi:hypothetical protein